MAGLPSKNGGNASEFRAGEVRKKGCEQAEISAYGMQNFTAKLSWIHEKTEITNEGIYIAFSPLFLECSKHLDSLVILTTSQ